MKKSVSRFVTLLILCSVLVSLQCMHAYGLQNQLDNLTSEIMPTGNGIIIIESVNFSHGEGNLVQRMVTANVTNVVVRNLGENDVTVISLKLYYSGELQDSEAVSVVVPSNSTCDIQTLLRPREWSSAGGNFYFVTVETEEGHTAISDPLLLLGSPPFVSPEVPDTTPPTISLVSPENMTYTVNHVDLAFTVSEPSLWMGYSLDSQANVTIMQAYIPNITLTGLSDGIHSLTVYAKDIAGNTGASKTITFRVTNPFPTTWIVVAIVIIAAVGAALLVYFRKVKKTTGEVEKTMAEGVT